MLERIGDGVVAAEAVRGRSDWDVDCCGSKRVIGVGERVITPPRARRGVKSLG